MKADWHTPAATAPSGDPFAETSDAKPETAAPVGRHQAKGAAVDPNFERLRTLVNTEARLADTGTTCELKDRDWSNPSCNSCTEHGTAGRAQLCRIGVAQEMTVANLRLAASPNAH